VEPEPALGPTPLERLARFLGPADDHRLARWVTLRLLGLVYLFAFLGHARQDLALLGADGLTPAADFLAWRAQEGDGFWQRPTLFWFDSSDGAIVGAAWLGVVLALAVTAGFANAPALGVLWILQLSFVHVGQVWTGYGWELQLAETGFLAMFLAPPLAAGPRPAHPPALAVIMLHRWLVFRIMLGAGLIKLRGDPCWRELTCLDWHFETQPVPGPLSAYFHALPGWMHAAGVLFNHLAELCAPWLLFGGRRLRRAGAAIMIAFQLVLIASGNLAFLNWLTLVPMLMCVDDGVWRRVLPRRLVGWLDAPPGGRRPEAPRGQRVAAGALAAVVAFLSIDPVANLASRRQVMNTSYEPLALVNTYGAFGSVGRRRMELVIEGTADARPHDGATWREYQLACKPGDPRRRPCVLGPYHHRLDWQIWFAAMGWYDEEPWVLHLVWKLLRGDARTLALLGENPFPDAPPRWIRIGIYRYRFAGVGDGAWWTRERLGDWLPPVSLDEEWLQARMDYYGWRR
jgi:hypothetical protein